MRRNDVYSNNICSNAMFVRKPQQYFLTDILFFNRKNVCFLIKHLLTKKKKKIFLSDVLLDQKAFKHNGKCF
jgi:hypothetical protein